MGPPKVLRSAEVLKRSHINPHVTSYILTSPPHPHSSPVLQPCCGRALPECGPASPLLPIRATLFVQRMLFSWLSLHNLPHSCLAKSYAASRYELRLRPVQGAFLDLHERVSSLGAPKAPEYIPATARLPGYVYSLSKP